MILTLGIRLIVNGKNEQLTSPAWCCFASRVLSIWFTSKYTIIMQQLLQLKTVVAGDCWWIGLHWITHSSWDSRSMATKFQCWINSQCCAHKYDRLRSCSNPNSYRTWGPHRASENRPWKQVIMFTPNQRKLLGEVAQHLILLLQYKWSTHNSAAIHAPRIAPLQVITLSGCSVASFIMFGDCLMVWVWIPYLLLPCCVVPDMSTM